MCVCVWVCGVCMWNKFANHILSYCAIINFSKVTPSKSTGHIIYCKEASLHSLTLLILYYCPRNEWVFSNVNLYLHHGHHRWALRIHLELQPVSVSFIWNKAKVYKVYTLSLSCWQGLSNPKQRHSLYYIFRKKNQEHYRNHSDKFSNLLNSTYT